MINSLGFFYPLSAEKQLLLALVCNYLAAKKKIKKKSKKNQINKSHQLQGLRRAALLQG